MKKFLLGFIAGVPFALYLLTDRKLIDGLSTASAFLRAKATDVESWQKKLGEDYK